MYLGNALFVAEICVRSAGRSPRQPPLYVILGIRTTDDRTTTTTVLSSCTHGRTGAVFRRGACNGITNTRARPCVHCRTPCTPTVFRARRMPVRPSVHRRSYGLYPGQGAGRFRVDSAPFVSRAHFVVRCPVAPLRHHNNTALPAAATTITNI